MLELPKLILKDITDIYIRNNFLRIQNFIEKFPLFRAELTHFEFEFDRALTSQNVAHGLGFRPTDLVQTFITGPGDLTWEYEKFDDKNLVVTTTGACKVRAFIGAYREGI